MRIVKLKGGLGNQMFQYAFAKLIEKRTGDVVKLDYSSFDSLENDSIRVPRLKKFNISLNPASQEELDDMLLLRHKGNSLGLPYKVGVYIEKTLNRHYAFEPNRAYINPDLISDKWYFDGYWQSYKYTDEIWDTLIQEFTPNYDLNEKTILLAEKMKSENSVFVGVRKGDYAETSYDFKHFGIIGASYYEKCLNFIDGQIGNPLYYVFTNDINWCKKNIDWGKRTVFYREPENQVSDFEELILMSSCNNAIIANSTFHWWGAQLISSRNKIICCPSKWFYDGKPIEIIPKNWKRFDI